MADEKKKDRSNVDESLSESARRLGSKGGKIGGKRRAEVLSAKERSDIARMGGMAKSAKAKSVKAKIKKAKKK